MSSVTLEAAKHIAEAALDTGGHLVAFLRVSRGCFSPT